MSRWLKKTIALCLIPMLMLLCLPNTSHADASSDAAAYSLGLAAVLLGVLVIIGLSSDIDHWRSGTHVEADGKTRVAKLTPVDIPIELQTLPQNQHTLGSGQEMQLAENICVGWKMKF